MKKTDLTKDLRQFNGGSGLITRAVLARFMGIANPRHVDKYLRGKDRIDGKYYLISDIAEELSHHIEKRS